ncbi:MAG: ABC transporter permease [Leptolyngbya sp. PLA3]|nr:MAG: ABC transporter permease [Cyanobacteria bacterium CYA]MCE7968509.1 ABC transporter permease [Leptolyngbya sp. PL-A3]
MRAVWRLAISNLWVRPWRSAMLVAAVGLSSALIAAVACALESVNRAIEAQLGAQVGDADARLMPSSSSGDFPASYLEVVESWGEVESARAELATTLTLALTKEGLGERGRPEAASSGVQAGDGAFVRSERMLRTSSLAHGVWFARGDTRLELIAGRMPTNRGQIVIDALTAERLSWEYAPTGSAGGSRLLSGRAEHLKLKPPVVPENATRPQAEDVNRAVGVRPGDRVTMFRLFGRRWEFEVVGVAAPPPLGGRPQVWVSMPDVEEILGRRGRLTLIEMKLREGVGAGAFVDARQAELGDRFLLQTTAKVRTGVEKNVASSQLGFVLAAVLSFLSAAFIIMTGLNTGLAEQRRSLAVLRCVGARPGHLAQTQLVIGLVVGGVGALLGVPLGIGVAWVLVQVFEEQMPSGLGLPALTLGISAIGAVVAGVGGALWPAWQASRLSPLAALTVRATPVKRAHVGWTLTAGCACLLTQALVVGLPSNGQVVFWGYATTGLPAMFLGYFLLGVPMVLLVVWVLAPALSRVLGLPKELLGRTMRATPYRYGFTAGAMMGGLALMVAIWTNGGGFLRDWLGRIRFPDAFVSGIALSEESQRMLDALPFVEETCAITMIPVETDAFGVRALQSYKTTFVAFETESFFDMADLDWVQGDAETAKRRLSQGGAVIVAREFFVAKGIGVGEPFRCSFNGQSHEFEVVGVVTSPGLELVSKFFNVGEEYIDQSLHAVFGSRADLKEKFGNESIGLIQIELSDDVDDETALATIRETVVGAGVLDAGSGRQIREQLAGLVKGFLLVFSVVAGMSMFIACFGVANVVAASIHARRFEFGVLRAMGAQRRLLSRLIAGEALIIALSAWMLGTAMGLQGAWAGRRLNAMLLGVEIQGRIEPWVVAAGFAVVTAFCLGASLPSIMRLNGRSTRELLSARFG